TVGPRNLSKRRCNLSTNLRHTTNSNPWQMILLRESTKGSLTVSFPICEGFPTRRTLRHESHSESPKSPSPVLHPRVPIAPIWTSILRIDFRGLLRSSCRGQIGDRVCTLSYMY